MSEVLRLAKLLSASSDEALLRTIKRRRVSTSGLEDFFDLSAVLLKPQSISAAIASLTKSQVKAFGNLIQNSSTKEDIPNLERLAELYLVEQIKTGAAVEFIPFEVAADFFQSHSRKVSKSSKFEPEPENVAGLPVDPQAGLAAFEACQGITELLVDLEQRFIRQVGKTSVGLPELKRLSSHIGKSVEYARNLYDIAHLAGLISIGDKRWRVGPLYQNWLSSEPAERWLILAKTWRDYLGDDGALELVSTRDLVHAIEDIFPLAESSLNTQNSKLLQLSELIGLSAAGKTSSWFSPLMTGDFEMAKNLLAKELPKSQTRIIVQADLSIISVGPLPTKLELELRRFVETERIGVASSYRISPLSISHGFETGLTEDDIRKLLAKLSGSELPQPVDYLIREAANRYGRLVIHQKLNGAVISSKDPILLTQILNDVSLKPISITRHSETSLETRFDMDITYYQLREAKYAAIRKNSSGEVISSWRKAGLSDPMLKPKDSFLEDISRWRDQELRAGESPQGSDLVRQIELCIKSKGSLQISVLVNKIEREFLLEPIGLANGRLRGKDRKADCERVIPLHSITGVRLG